MLSAIIEEYADEKFTQGEKWRMYLDVLCADSYIVEPLDVNTGLLFRFTCYDEALAFKELAERSSFEWQT